MRTMPYLIKNSADVWCVQRKVPEPLQAAVARVLGSKKQTQKYLKKSLGTKDRREANRRATHALADLDRTLREAEALTRQQPSKPTAPLRTTLNDAEIKRMGEYVYAKTLAWDERFRFGRDEFKRIEAEHIRLEGGSIGPWATPYDELPPHGLTPAMLKESREELAESLKDYREALALGDISAVEDSIVEALDVFHIDLDRQGVAYPKLGIEILRAYVRALQAIEQRNAGEPVPTPQLVSPPTAAASGTLREAFEGWKKERDRPNGTLHEYGRAIEMFIQLHGNLAILEIKRSHARTFREALQLVPKSRKGALLKSSLPELSAHGRAHPSVQKVSPGTINKQLGAVQAIAGWGRHNGLVPEDASWSDPFNEMRLEEEQSQREPFATILDQIKANGGKCVLFDPTGEFAGLPSIAKHYAFNEGEEGTERVHFPYTQTTEEDLFALFRPSGQSQGPKLREAIRSLKLVRACRGQAPDGVRFTARGTVEKSYQPREPFYNAIDFHRDSINSPLCNFRIEGLAEQVIAECVWSSGQGASADSWGGPDNSVAHCETLVARITSSPPAVSALHPTPPESAFAQRSHPS